MQAGVSQLELRPGHTLAVRVIAPAGAPSGTTVYLMHGGGGRSAQWRDVWPGLLAAGHRIVAFDALGHGDSPAPRRWSAYAGRVWVADLLDIVGRYGGERRVLVGHSYGSLVVLAALHAGAPQIERAVLLAPPDPAGLPTSWITYLPVPLLERMRPKLSAGFRAAAWGPQAPAALVDEETRISDRNSLYVFKALWRQRLRLDAAALRTIAQPVHVLAGEHDRLTPPDGARRLAESLPAGRFELLRGGHQLPLECPQRVVDAVLAGRVT